MIVMKFGGSSLSTPARLERMAALVAGEDRPKVVVVSAMGKTTNHLLAAGEAAEQGDWTGVREQISAIETLTFAAVSDPDCDRITRELLAELSGLLQGVSLLREQTPRSRALLASFGERLAVGIASAHLRAIGLSSSPVDARELVRTNATFEEARVDRRITGEQVRAVLLPLIERGETPVITGFIGRTVDGLTTVLGRSGSDYTASLLGEALEVEEVVIWTDVDGILTADPRKVSEARTLPAVTYREAAEMSYFGAQVIHPKTMVPVVDARIPIRVRSTLDLESSGTVIGPSGAPSLFGVKTVTSVDDLCLLTIEGQGMAGLVGTARKIFAATERVSVNVIMISQASSEQSVSLVIRAADAQTLVDALTEAFQLEIEAGLLAPIVVSPGISVVSIIGEGMSGTSGVSARLFGALGKLHVNVRAIAQAASELSISVAVDGAHVDRVVRAVHTVFGLTRIVHIALIGLGSVGRNLLKMLDAVDFGDVELQVVLAANSRTWVVDSDGIPPLELEERLASGEPRPSDADLIEALASRRFTDILVVDVTAAPTASLHLAALQAGFHVVTANKIPLSGPFSEYRTLVDARDASGVHYGYETTFGAGLPVLHTLKELVATGDSVRTVEGCFSGTLGFLTSELDAGVSLVDAVKKATELGYTEPDPREDLSGRDVARKALIIARAMGRSIELADIKLEPFVPGLEAGLAITLTKYASKMAERVELARSRSSVLRYVAQIGETVTVSLQEVPASSPIGSLHGPDNILVFTTERYADHPLVVRGPGAGAEVTAAGVLGDLLKIARQT